MPATSKPTKFAPVVEAKAPEVKETKASKTKVAEAPVEVAPVQKGGKAKKEAVQPPAPVVEQAPVVAPKAKASKAKAVEVAPVEVAPTQTAGGKKAAKKAQPKPVEVKTETEPEGEVDEKGVRSFKVQLPGNEEFTGRFTGLTPYQAANKALSKYFRENKSAMNEITFSIRESTRGSKRGLYTYNGKREKLVTPVKYSITAPDGNAREIVKEYKNKLIKVKKTEA